jgi:hypothetical protein
MLVTNFITANVCALVYKCVSIADAAVLLMNFGLVKAEHDTCLRPRTRCSSEPVCRATRTTAATADVITFVCASGWARRAPLPHGVPVWHTHARCSMLFSLLVLSWSATVQLPCCECVRYDRRIICLVDIRFE